MGRKRASSSPLVGLDLGTSGLRAVQVKTLRSGAVEITRAASVDLPRGVLRNGAVSDVKALTAAIKQLWKQGRFSTKRVAFGLADAGVLTRQLDLPWMPPDDFRSALRYQVDDALPVDVSTVELDYHLLGRTDAVDSRGQSITMNRILVVAADTAAVTALAQALRRARLEPVVADSTALALIRAACGDQLPVTGVTRAIADVGADHVTVVIHRDGQPAFIRTVANLGGDTATETLAERLTITLDDAEALKRRVGLKGPAPILAPIAESSIFAASANVEDIAPDPLSAAAIEALNPWPTSIIAEIRNSIDYYQSTPGADAVASLTLVGRSFSLTGMQERVATQIPLPVDELGAFAGLAHARKLDRLGIDDSRLATAIGLAKAVER